MLHRRIFFTTLSLALGAAAQHGGKTVQGKLVQKPGGKPALETAPGRLLYLEGDAPTTAVLGDKRLAGMELELVGHLNTPGTFTVDPIHTKAMFVLKDNKKLFITYWCDVCSIRTHSPGRCWCCQEETNLDLRESLEP